MPRYVAFLRAINVGGHVVKMDRLSRLFEEIGFSGVETFIASGNVVIDSPSRSAPALERKIEGHLGKALGYDVSTFLRTLPEVGAIARYEPFDAADLAREGNSLYIAFTASRPGAEAIRQLGKCATKADDFHVNGREIYWLLRKKFSESAFSGAFLEKILGMPATIRNSTTVRKIAAKYSAKSGEGT